jgi:uridine phosphorylase
MEVLGVHTLVPGLTSLPAAYKGTILEHSKGFLPPYLVVCGDRRRVEHIASFLENATLLRPQVARAGGDPSRVEVAVGTYKGTPIAAIETEMGCPATEIIVREVVSDLASRLSFRQGNFQFQAPHRYVIRLGSAAGINGTQGPPVKPFDAVIATHSVGVSGADIQALTGNLNFFDTRLLSQASATMQKLGYTSSTDKQGQVWHSLAVSPDLRSAMVRASKLLKPPAENKEMQVLELGNFSKDSLYAEANEKSFTELRDLFGVGTSEMELATITRVAAQSKLHNQPLSVGQLTLVVGTIPGLSFVHDKPREAASMNFAVELVLESLHQISLEHRSPAAKL